VLAPVSVHVTSVPDTLEAKFTSFIRAHVHRSPTPRSRAGLTAVPLFHAAWLFAAGIALAGRSGCSRVLCSSRWRSPLRCVGGRRCAGTHGLAAAGALWLLLGAWCEEMEPHPAAAPALAALSDGLLRTVEGTVTGAGPVRTEPQETNLDQNVDEPSPTSPPSASICAWKRRGGQRC